MNRTVTGRFRLCSPLVILLVIVAACIDPFPPPPGTESLDLLVVDGFLNGSTGVAEVRLSRSLPLSSGDGYPNEGGATVRVIDESGNAFLLPEVVSEPGVYRAINNSLSI